MSKASLTKTTVKAYNRQRPYGYRQQLCYAPFTSMFFSRAGYMSPCYATYSEKSDRWPDKSIKASWFKGEFENIRKHVADYDLDYACRFCKPIFASHNFGSLLPNKYESYGISTQAYPKIMEFELSNRCNLECIMCDGNLSSAIRKNREKKPPLPDHYNQDFVEELKEFIPHLQMAEFTGGDPFLIPMYYDIWKLINSMNPKCQVLITTNANTMNNRIETMLQTYNNLHFNISIDSLNKEHYEQIRRGANFDDVIRNTKRFISYCHQHNTSCNLLVCPLTINSRDFQGLIEFANKQDICVYFHTVIKPRELSLKHQSPEYLQDIIKRLKSWNPPEKTKNQKTNAENYKSLINLLSSWRNKNIKKSDIENIDFDADTYLMKLKTNVSADAYKRFNEIIKNHKNHDEILLKCSKIKFKDIEYELINSDKETISEKIKSLIQENN